MLDQRAAAAEASSSGGAGRGAGGLRQHPLRPPRRALRLLPRAGDQLLGGAGAGDRRPARCSRAGAAAPADRSLRLPLPRALGGGWRLRRRSPHPGDWPPTRPGSRVSPRPRWSASASPGRSPARGRPTTSRSCRPSAAAQHVGQQVARDRHQLRLRCRAGPAARRSAPAPAPAPSRGSRWRTPARPTERGTAWSGPLPARAAALVPRARSPRVQVVVPAAHHLGARRRAGRRFGRARSRRSPGSRWQSVTPVWANSHAGPADGAGCHE